MSSTTKKGVGIVLIAAIASVVFGAQAEYGKHIAFATEDRSSPPKDSRIIRIGSPGERLATKWIRALREARTSEHGFWIGYRFKRTAKPRSDYGSVRGGHLSFADRLSVSMIEHDAVVVFRFDSTGRSIQQIRATDLHGKANLDGLDLYWLDRVASSESLTFLEEKFARQSKTALLKPLLWSISMHDQRGAVLSFLTDVLDQPFGVDVRKAAVYAVGNVGTPAAQRVLEALAEQLVK